MSETLVDRVKSNLKAECYLVNDSWLKDCIEYYISENTDASLGAVQAFVTSQWLLSDLREINNEKGCLPANFVRQQKIVLQGTYIIQVEKMYDISQSKYSQIQKIRNVSEVNVKATAIEAPAWEPKGKRMIQMFLTDGVQDFTAIEYRPIKTLKDTLLPGFKLMIIGPVMCRRGVIMLKEENYKEIGGEVDSLLKVNALENILARALGMEENENPYADENQENNALQADNEFPEDEFEIDLDEITQIERLSMEGRESPVIRVPNTEVSNPRNNVPTNRTDQSKKENSVIRPATDDYYNPQQREGNNVQRNSRIEMIDDSKSSSLKQKKTFGDESKIVSRTQLKPMISVPSSNQFQDNDMSKFHNRGMKDVRSDFKKRLDQPSTSYASTVVFPEELDFDVDDFEDDMNEFTLRKNNTVLGSARNTTMITNSSKVLPKLSTKVEKKIHSAKRTPPTTTNIVNSPEKRPTLSAGKRSADTLSPLGCSSKIICLDSRAPSDIKNRKITEFTEKIIPKEELPPKICDFICEVIREPRPGSITYKTVRGRVTQIGKLLKKDKNWELRATISDGTASLEIVFASQVLEEFIGFTVQEFSEKKKLRKTNPEVEEYLRGGFRNAEIRVQRMDVLMELELPAEKGIPIVINTTELSEAQKQHIEKRIKMMAV